MDFIKTIMIVFCIVIFGIFLSIGRFGCAILNNGTQTITKEFQPSELLRKYEWFKDCSAQLDRKIADLKNYEARFDNLKNEYQNKNRSQWSREDREQFNIWQCEYLGVKSSYNDLSAQYNSSMAKFNYKFCNVGTLPEGATEPLNREYKEYK